MTPDPKPSEPLDEIEFLEKVVATIGNAFQSKLMNLLLTRPGIGISEMADWTGEPTSSVRREIKKLVERGLVGIERQEPRRGVVKRYYVRSDNLLIGVAEDERLSDRDRQLTTLAVVRRLFEEARRGIASGIATNRSDRIAATTPGEVDEQGWKELAELHVELMNKTQQVIAESRERLALGDQDAIVFTSGQILLELPPLSQDSW